MPLSVCKPDAWYLLVRCKHCDVRQPLHCDFSQGKSELLRDYKHTCVECGHTDVYTTKDIERYQHKAAWNHLIDNFQVRL